MPSDNAPNQNATRLQLADELLVVRCQLGEPAAFDELVEQWSGPILRYAGHVLGQDDRLADVVQDIWLRVLRGLPHLREPARFRAWIFGVARRSLMDVMRQRYAEPVSVDIDEANESSTIAGSDSPFDADLVIQMQHHLQLLPVHEREALDLFYIQELDQAQIAEILGVPVGTVKSRLFRARKLLRRALADSGEAP
ncbi:MAG: sigma-70 family RNA polymerase sigma factor [Gemmatimonadaceae bacterium]|nr:sigma-70 family RNA polymerase sigma factor [Gemmatimonadaceae bacterium]